MGSDVADNIPSDSKEEGNGKETQGTGTVILLMEERI